MDTSEKRFDQDIVNFNIKGDFKSILFELVIWPCPNCYFNINIKISSI